MSRRASIGGVVVLVVALAGVAALIRLVHEGDDGGARRPESSSPIDSSRPAMDAAAATPAALDPTRNVATTPAAAPPDDREDADDATTREAALVGIVQDASGRPIADATIVVLLPPGRSFNMLDLEYRYRTDRLAELRSDQQGRFSFRLERGRPIDLDVSAAGFARRGVVNRFAGERVVVVLDRGCTLSGRLTHQDDGSAVADARLRVFRYAGTGTFVFWTKSDVDGRYRFDGLPSEQMVLEILPQRDCCPDWIRLEFAPDGTLVKDAALARGFVARGHVTDAKSGKPIAGAEIAENWTFNRTVLSDASGAFELRGFAGSSMSELNVRAAGYGRKVQSEIPAAVEGAVAVDFALTPARSVTGRVVDASNAPVAGAYIAAVGKAFGLRQDLTDWPSTSTGADGRFEIADLTAEIRHTLLVQKCGTATVVFDLPAAELDGPSLDVGAITLAAPALLLGRVVDAEGKGVANVDVTLSGRNRDSGRLLRPNESPPNSNLRNVESRTVRSDDRGRFSFADLPEGEFTLKASPAGTKETALTKIAIAAGEVKSGVVITIPTGARIAGRVVLETGEGIAGVRVAVESMIGREARVSTQSEADGRFELRGLSEGRYRLNAYPYFPDRTDALAHLLPVDLDGVASDATDLRIVLRVGHPISGRLLDEDGKAANHAWVLANGADGTFVGGAMVEDDGRFTLYVPVGAIVDLTARWMSSTRGGREIPTLRTSVQAGSRDVELRIPASDSIDPARRDGRGRR